MKILFSNNTFFRKKAITFGDIVLPIFPVNKTNDIIVPEIVGAMKRVLVITPGIAHAPAIPE